MHKTSLNLNFDLFELMTETADGLNIPVSDLIKRVVARFSKQNTKRIKLSKDTISYQNAGSDWHTFPIRYSDPEYEQVLDIRKVWRLSVSFFVTIAFLDYLNCPEGEKCLKNSYMLLTYFSKKEIVNKRIVLTFTWGKEPETRQRE